MRALSCIFPVFEIAKTANFYEKELGFRKVEYLNVSEPHVCLYRDNIEIILLKANKAAIPNRDLYGYGYDAYIYTSNQEELYKEYSGRGLKIVKNLTTTDYDNKEFVVEDLDGRWLAFGLKNTI